MSGNPPREQIQPRDPDTNEPLKLACVRCIRGHRTSSCNHFDGSKGPVTVVKRRGRPSSQCRHCHERREKTGRHVKCNCGNRKSNTQTAAPPHTTSNSPGPSTSPLSFSNLLNPCKCNTSGICTCGCIPLEDLRRAMVVRKPEQKSCCSSKRPPDGPPAKPESKKSSLSVLIEAADISREYEPTCNCGDNCSCNGCYKHSKTIPTLSKPELGAKEEEAAADVEIPPEDCTSCVACDLGLKQPVGIDAVDRWAGTTNTTR